ncbi:hypothetical protein [Vibrio hepatarius]|uniref:hypothetical protein n=1 Tax=Vibrio hepatarius TaxID=171383 RepID=UPI001C096EA9|nr:hypothetical protein [Vibrio hepatarius]MBU2897705.1 hypothetical protein [Vibrio hepatarius]
MSITEIRKAVNKSLLGGEAWPPSLPEFIARGDLLDVDFDAAFSRMLRGKSLGEAEYWANQEVGFECRRYLDEPRARAKHRAALRKYLEKDQQGALPPRDLVQIEDKSTLPSIENRPKPKQFCTGSVFARVAERGRRA